MIYYILGVITGIFLSFIAILGLIIFKNKLDLAIENITKPKGKAEIVDPVDPLDSLFDYENNTNRTQDLL